MVRDGDLQLIAAVTVVRSGTGRPVFVDFGEVDEDGEVDGAEHGQQPVEVIKPRHINVLRQPRRPPIGDVTGGGIDGVVERRGEKAPEPSGDGGIGRANAAHGIGRLLVEELDEADEAEDLGDADEAVLDEQPVCTEPRHGRQEQAQVAVLHGVAAPVPLEDAGPGD